MLMNKGVLNNNNIGQCLGFTEVEPGPPLGGGRTLVVSVMCVGLAGMGSLFYLQATKSGKSVPVEESACLCPPTK